MRELWTLKRHQEVLNNDGTCTPSGEACLKKKALLPIIERSLPISVIPHLYHFILKINFKMAVNETDLSVFLPHNVSQTDTIFKKKHKMMQNTRGAFLFFERYIDPLSFGILH